MRGNCVVRCGEYYYVVSNEHRRTVNLAGILGHVRSLALRWCEYFRQTLHIAQSMEPLSRVISF